MNFREILSWSPLNLAKSGGRDFTWCVRIFPVKFLDCFLSVGNVLGWFPTIVSLIKALPAYEVLELMTMEPAVQDTFNYHSSSPLTSTGSGGGGLLFSSVS